MRDKSYKNPIRRNRNIGTAKQGYGKNNKMVVPERWTDNCIFKECLSNSVVVQNKIGNTTISILVEPTRAGYLHACTVDDIIKLLTHIPEQHLSEIKTFILRQPSKKEEILKPVWGRLSYWTNLGNNSGPAIHLDAQKVDMVTKWDKSLSPIEKKELARLHEDGHEIVSNKRHHIIHSNIESIRNTQLYRTIPHEIGHYVDYMINVTEPSKGSTTDVKERLEKKHKNKPLDEKEAVAHRYAEEFLSKRKMKDNCHSRESLTLKEWKHKV